jgi:4-hydroxybenzoate polyprenyltransferase
MAVDTDQPRRRRRPDRSARAEGAARAVRRGRPRRATRRGWRETLPVALLRCAHPRQALVVTLTMGGAAAVAGRSTREVGLVLATVLVGQVVLGWHNDVVDTERDRRHHRTDKPIALGHVDRGTVAFSLACGILLVVPLSVANGVVAGVAHLAALLVAMVGNAGLLRRSRFSYLPWMASFGLLPAFLSYGGWAGEGDGGPPTIAMTVLAALLGIGVHVTRALPGLVDDDKDGNRTFPLRIALRTGAPRLLLLATVYNLLVAGGILIAARTVGLVQ